MKGYTNMNYGFVMNYRTACDIRPATREELRASLDAARHDGGRGVFLDSDGTPVYVTGESADAGVEATA